MNFPVEPGAEIRAGAKQMFALFLAFQEAGFSREEALQLIAAVMARPAPPG